MIEIKKYMPHAFQKNKIPEELWKELYTIILEEGYLCYHSEESCFYIISKLVELLHKFKITKEWEGEE